MTKLLAPKPPTPPKPEPIPQLDDEAMKREKMKKVAEQSSRSGRASTILSQNDGFGL